MELTGLILTFLIGVLLFRGSNYHNIFEVFITEDSKSSSLWVSIEK